MEPEFSEPMREKAPSLPPATNLDAEIAAVLGASIALGDAASSDELEPEIGPQQPDEPDFAAVEPPVASTSAPDDAIIVPSMDRPEEINQAEEAEFDAPPIPLHPSVRQGRGDGRKIAAIVMAIALLGGTGALAWNYIGSDNGAAPVILADKDPVKVKPKDSGGEVVPNQEQTVFNKVDGSDSTKPVQIKLRNRSEEPINVAGVKADSRVSPSNTRNAESEILRPRSVRTVVVKPDGTIVSSTENSNTATESPTPTGGLDLARLAPEPTTDESVDVAKIETVDPQPVKVKPIAVKPVKVKTVPKVEPISTGQKPAPKSEPAPAANKEEPASAEELPQVASAYAVQISSRRSAESAKDAWRKLSKRFSGVLGGEQVDIRRTEITGKGIYYRVRVAADSRDAARQLCTRLKSAGGDCLVTR